MKKDDIVALYLPLVLEALTSFPARSRICAVHSIVSAGFSSDSLRDRMIDANSKVVITSDEGKRGGKIIGTKEVVDNASKQCPNVTHCLVFKRTAADLSHKDKLNETYERDVFATAPLGSHPLTPII